MPSDDASYWIPFACTDAGLDEVAARHVEKGSYSTLAESREKLRWSVADSPWFDAFPDVVDAVEEALRGRPEPHTLPDAKARRETRTRIDSVLLGLQELDAEGCFDDDGRRVERFILLEAGDRTEDFVLTHARKLNPPDVFKRLRKMKEGPSWGAFTEFGRKLHTTLSIAMTADRKHLAAGSDRLYVFDLQAKRELWHYQIKENGCAQGATVVRMSADGSVLAVRGSKLLYVWKDLERGSHKSYPLASDGFVVDPLGRWIAIPWGEKIMVISPDGEVIAEPSGLSRQLATSVDGALLASADGQSRITIWNTATWTPIQTIEQRAHDLAFAPDGKSIVSAVRYGLVSRDSTGRDALVRWDVERGTKIREYRVDGYFLCGPTFDASGQRIACCACQSSDGLSGPECFVLDASTGALVDRLRFPHPVAWFNEVAFASDREVVVAGQTFVRRAVVLWQLAHAPMDTKRDRS